MNILHLPKENYPFQRVRLNQLFMIYFATEKDKVFWITYGKGPNCKVESNNIIYLLRPLPIKG